MSSHVPPSQQSAQGPVPKPGEPIEPIKGVLAARPYVAPAPAVEPKSKKAAERTISSTRTK